MYNNNCKKDRKKTPTNKSNLRHRLTYEYSTNFAVDEANDTRCIV